MRLLDNWKFLVVVYILSAGLWGFSVKLILRRLDWVTTTFLILVSNVLFVGLLCSRFVRWTWNPVLPFVVLTGALAGVASLAFYRAMSLAPASVVIPLTSQFILVTVLLSFLLFKEPLSWRLFLGIGTAIASIILLAGASR